jgi:peptidoglycan-associated lipoprotein
MKRMGIMVLLTLTAISMLGLPALSEASCLLPGGSKLAEGLAEGPRPLGGPISESRRLIPTNGTGGFSVFGADTIGKGGFSIGVGAFVEDAVCQGGGVEDFATLFVPLAYGILQNLDVMVSLPYTWYNAEKANYSGQGPDDLMFGLVYRFLDEKGPMPALAVVPYAAAPTGFRHQGTGRNAWDVGVSLAATKTFLPELLGHANVGYLFKGESHAVDLDDQFTSGVAAEYLFSKHLSFVGEAVADTNARTGKDRHSDWVAELRGGLRIRYGNFLVSLAGRKGLTNDAPDWGAFALITYTQAGPGAPERLNPPAGAGPGAGGAGGPAAGGPGAGGPAAGGPGAGGPAAGGPGAGGPAAGGPGAGGPAAGGPGAGGPAAGGPGAGGPAAGGPGAGGPGAGPGAGGPGPGAGGPGPLAAVPPAALPPPLRSALVDVHFEFDSYALTAEARSSLATLAEALKGNRSFTVLAEGHADERGTSEYNLALGDRRAQAVKDHLTSLGVEPSRVDTMSYGEERPLDPGHDEMSWALNRRVHFTVRVRQ